MNNQLSEKIEMCTEYLTILNDTEVTLTNWNKGRAEIYKSGCRGRESDNVLRTLQAKYAKSLALLQNHEHRCEVCQWVSNFRAHGLELIQRSSLTISFTTERAALVYAQ